MRRFPAYKLADLEAESAELLYLLEVEAAGTREGGDH